MKNQMFFFLISILIISNLFSINQSKNSNSLTSSIKSTVLNFNNYKEDEELNNNFLPFKGNSNLDYVCSKGSYTYLDSCVITCPEPYLADNSELTCKLIDDHPIYIQAYSLSQCINSCGKEYSDCSCKEDCKYNGTCCSDYKICEMIDFYKPPSEKSDLPENLSIEYGCDHLNTDKTMCLQCKNDFYFHENQCVDSCPSGNHMSKNNRICIKDNLCESNCETCNNTTRKCISCEIGFFLYEGKCLQTCPKDFVADRVKFKCISKSSKDLDSSFYWIYPSGKSCSNMCGIKYLHNKVMCSCEYDCIRKGNCCDDFAEECLATESFKEKCTLCDYCDSKEGCLKCKNNSSLNIGENFEFRRKADVNLKQFQKENNIEFACVCNEGFSLNLYSNECEKESENQIKDSPQKLISNSTLFNNTIIQDSIHDSNSNSLDINKTLNHFSNSTNIQGSFISNFIGALAGIGKDRNLNNQNLNDNLPKKFFMKGNTSVHFYKGNTNMKMIKSQTNNKNSHNIKSLNSTKLQSDNIISSSLKNQSSIRIGESVNSEESKGNLINKSEEKDDDYDDDDTEKLLFKNLGLGESMRNFGRDNIYKLPQV